jgi:hypothetical protein
MPQVFKALATIMAWILWICALLLGFGHIVMGISRGTLFGAQTPPMVSAAMFAVAGFLAISAVVIMILRKKME